MKCIAGAFHKVRLERKPGYEFFLESKEGTKRGHERISFLRTELFYFLSVLCIQIVKWEKHKPSNEGILMRAWDPN